MRKALEMYIENQKDKELSSSEVEILGLHMAGVTRPQIAKQLNIGVQTVDRRLLSAQNTVALKNPDSIVARGRKAVNRLIPKSIRTYDKALNDYSNRPGLAVKTATEILKGTQVLIPKEIQESSKETVETKRVIMLERLEIAVQMGAVVPVAASIEPELEPITPSEALESSQTDPTPTHREADQGGTDEGEIPPSQSDHDI